MGQTILSESIILKVKERFGETPPQEVSQRIAGELALIEANGWEADFLRGYEITRCLRLAGPRLSPMRYDHAGRRSRDQLR